MGELARATLVTVASFACALAMPSSRVEAAGSAGTQTVVNAEARAQGNRRSDAVALGSALLQTRWPAQVLKVRIDGIASHEVAGLVLSGVKFHAPTDPEAFTNEVIALVQRTFAHSRVEEVDVWATVPLHVGEHVVVAGDNAQPTTRTVYGATVRRSEEATFPARLHAGDGVFWDRSWKRSL